MANTRATVKQIDVTRAVKGAVAAGLAVARIEVDHRTGKTVIFCDGAAPNATNPWDELIK